MHFSLLVSGKVHMHIWMAASLTIRTCLLGHARTASTIPADWYRIRQYARPVSSRKCSNFVLPEELVGHLTIVLPMIQLDSIS